MENGSDVCRKLDGRLNAITRVASEKNAQNTPSSPRLISRQRPAHRPLRAMKLSTILPGLIALTILQPGLIQPSHAADTNAVIPYKTVDDLCQIAGKVDQSKLNV